MEKNLYQSESTEEEPGWDDERGAYLCADRVAVRARAVAGRTWSRGTRRQPPANAIGYSACARRRRAQVQVFLSGAELSRDMAQLVRGAREARTAVFPPSVRRARDRAFCGCEALRAVLLNEGLEALGEFQGRGCSGVFRSTGLKSVALPGTMRVLGDCTFWGCVQLRRVSFAAGGCLERIGELCFAESGVAEVTLPRTLKQVAGSAFSGCEGLSLGAEDGCAVCLSDLRIPPARTGRVPVGRLDFSELRKLRDVVVPDGAERVERGWFWGSEVRSVELPASVRAIDERAFQECATLRRVTFPRGSGLETLGAHCFAQSGLRDFALPGSIVSIGDGAFAGCGNLRRLALHEHCRLERVGKECFCGSALEEFAGPAHLQEIGHNAFRDCKALRRVVLGPGPEELVGVFADSGVESVVLPPTLRRMSAAFAGCKSLRRVQIPDGLEEAGYECFAESGIEDVSFPRTLRRLGYQAFAECRELRRVWLRWGLDCIEGRCFYCSTLREISFPATLRQVGWYAFQYSHLATVYLEEGCGLDLSRCIRDSVSVELVPDVDEEP